MKIYRTVAGDTFDLISYKTLGSCRYTEKVINKNRQHIETFIFKAGVEIIIPEVENVRTAKLPPWRRG